MLHSCFHIDAEKPPALLPQRLKNDFLSPRGGEGWAAAESRRGRFKPLSHKGWEVLEGKNAFANFFIQQHNNTTTQHNTIYINIYIHIYIYIVYLPRRCGSKIAKRPPYRPLPSDTVPERGKRKRAAIAARPRFSRPPVPPAGRAASHQILSARRAAVNTAYHDYLSGR